MTEETQKKAIPSLSFNDNQIVVKTHDVPLEVNGEMINVKMKKLTAGEKQDLIKKNATVKLVGTQTTGSVDGIGYQIGLLSKVIIEAPFPVTEKDIANLPEEILDYLYNEYAEFTEGKKKD